MNYNTELSKRVKNREIDILLVVNMFLTGFDSKFLNTLYVDKNLRYHGLIQAFSRTNRILNEKKSQGNIVCFRDLKENVDEAIALFSDKEASSVILLEPYQNYVKLFNKIYHQLLKQVPDVNSVNELESEKEEFDFITKFRDLLRVKNILSSFSDYNPEDVAMPEQDFEDYKSKYLDLYERRKNRETKEKTSILDDIDFELELIRRDDITVAYILALLANLKKGKTKEEQEQHEKQKKSIIDLILSNEQLRSKRALFEEFINKNLPYINNEDKLNSEFLKFWKVKKEIAFNQISENESIEPEKLEKVISDYLYSGTKPIRTELLKFFELKISVLKQKEVGERIIEQIINFVDTYITGIPEDLN